MRRWTPPSRQMPLRLRTTPRSSDHPRQNQLRSSSHGLTPYALSGGLIDVHRLPGGAVCIVPSTSKQRGRVFLAFADDDPKTAELVAKVLMLARDGDVRDPTTLERLCA